MGASEVGFTHRLLAKEDSRGSYGSSTILFLLLPTCPGPVLPRCPGHPESPPSSGPPWAAGSWTRGLGHHLISEKGFSGQTQASA